MTARIVCLNAGFRRRSWYHYVLFRPLPFLPNFEPA